VNAAAPSTPLPMQRYRAPSPLLPTGCPQESCARAHEFCCRLGGCVELFRLRKDASNDAELREDRLAGGPADPPGRDASAPTGPVSG
jgi:hypothetical protein